MESKWLMTLSSSVKILAQLVPFGSAAVTAWDEFLENKKRIFFEELENQNIELHEDLIKSNDFLHSYFVTFEAVKRTRRKEKIQYFARLFSSVLSAEGLKNLDEFDSYLEALDNLSYREIKALKILHELEVKNGVSSDDHSVSRLKKTSAFWEHLVDEIACELEIPPNEVNDILIMTERTGCYISARPQANDYRRVSGTTTDTFKNLIQIIKPS